MEEKEKKLFKVLMPGFSMSAHLLLIHQSVVEKKKVECFVSKGIANGEGSQKGQLAARQYGSEIRGEKRRGLFSWGKLFRREVRGGRIGYKLFWPSSGPLQNRHRSLNSFSPTSYPVQKCRHLFLCAFMPFFFQS